MAQIVPLSAIEPALIEALLDRAFGTDRHARTAYRIRAGMDWLPGPSFAMLDTEEYLVGTIQLWPVGLADPDGRLHPLLMVGPVAVLPERQNEGFGKALTLAALDAVDSAATAQTPALPQVLIGDPDYYGRFFGFSAQATGGWLCPGPFQPERLLVRCANTAILPKEGMLGPWADPALPQTGSAKTAQS